MKLVDVLTVIRDARDSFRTSDTFTNATVESVYDDIEDRILRLALEEKADA